MMESNMEEPRSDAAFDFELRRALLEDTAEAGGKGLGSSTASDADAHKAFRRFVRRNGLERVAGRRRTRLYALVSVAAACVAALVVLALWPSRDNSAHEELERMGNVVYEAHDQVRYITLQVGGQQVSCKGSAYSQNGIRVTSDNEIEVFRVPDMEVEDATVSVPAGQTAKVTLDDGTVIHLNAGSSLSFPNRFEPGGRREVRLKGEALFEVTHDEASPFVVDCGRCRTTVLGTRFDIRAYDEANAVVTLIEGSVRVDSDHGQTTLAPGQSVEVASEVNGDNAHTVAEADIDVVTAWQQGLFYYHGQTLRQILTDIGRWYNVNVVFASDRHLNDRLHLNTERALPIADVVTQIQMISEATITAKGNALVVR